MANLGFRILPRPEGPDRKLVERLGELATPLLSDNMNRLQGGPADLRPFHQSRRLAGAAFTVRTRAGDNLMVHKAIDTALPGDVIVVEAEGEMSQAILGEIMLRLAESRGLAGFVVNGAIRDSAAFYERDYPCFARGATHRGPYKEGPGEINVPIQIGGMLVRPGDIIVGDDDGVVAVPLEHAEEVLRLAEAQKAREEQTFRDIAAGTVDRSWVNDTLKRKGCEGG